MKEARQALRVGTRLARRWDDYELTYKTATRDEFDMLWCYWRGQLHKEYQERRPRFLGFSLRGFCSTICGVREISWASPSCRKPSPLGGEAQQNATQSRNASKQRNHRSKQSKHVAIGGSHWKQPWEGAIASSHRSGSGGGTAFCVTSSWQVGFP